MLPLSAHAHGRGWCVCAGEGGGEKGGSSCTSKLYPSCMKDVTDVHLFSQISWAFRNKKIASISCIGEKNSRPSTGLAHEWLRLNKNFVYLTLFSTGLKCSQRRVLVNCGIVLCFADQPSQETIEPSKLIKLSHAKKGSYTRKKFSFQKLHFYIVYWLLFLPPAKRTGLRTVKVVGRWEGDQSIDSTPKRLCFVKLLLTVNYNIAFFSHLPPIITCGKAVRS